MPYTNSHVFLHLAAAGAASTFLRCRLTNAAIRGSRSNLLRHERDRWIDGTDDAELEAWIAPSLSMTTPESQAIDFTDSSTEKLGQAALKLGGCSDTEDDSVEGDSGHEADDYEPVRGVCGARLPLSYLSIILCLKSHCP